jgi:hypothetical protein
VRTVSCLLFIFLFVSLCAGDQGDGCPAGMVFGGEKCEYRNLCPDRRPMPPGGCRVVTPPPPPPKGRGANPIPPTSLPRKCEREVVHFSKPRGARVLLVKGSASQLLARYLAANKQEKVNINLKLLEVLFRDSAGGLTSLKGGVDITPTITETLTAMTWETVWLSRLRGRVAADVDHPEVEAQGLKADLLCGR